MNKYEVNELPELDRNELIDILTDELPVLRAKLGISQDDISSIIGISRQTYSAIETKKRRIRYLRKLIMLSKLYLARMIHLKSNTICICRINIVTF